MKWTCIILTLFLVACTKDNCPVSFPSPIEFGISDGSTKGQAPITTLAELARRDFGVSAWCSPEGETFGEMGMIENAPRSASAIALADQTEVQEINATEFSDYFEEKPVQVFLLVKQLSHRLRETTRNYEEACRTVSETVAAEKKGEERSGGLKNKLRFFADVYRGFVNGEKAD